MENPFETIARRLTNVEELLLDIKHRPTAPAPVLPSPDEPLTPTEAATLFKTSKVSLWSWERKGIIKGYHLGNKKYFLRGELMAALTKKVPA